MYVEKNETKAMSLTVTEGLTVTILPDSNHEFIMSTKQIALGYGVTEYAIRQSKLRNDHELIEGKHYLSGVTIRHGASPGASKSTMWTKRGIVRLGFFIKSERAKLFRDWAEELVIDATMRTDTTCRVPAKQALPGKRLINRLDRNRMVRLLAMTARIDDSTLRNEIVNELVAGFDYGKGGQA